MRRRNTELEVIQVLLSLAIIVLTAMLFFRSRELTVLFPVVFGLAALLALLYALEGLIYNRNRVVKKSRVAVFTLLALILGALTYVSARVVA